MKLILFDIDGTLIWPDGAGRLAMQRALVEIFGSAGPVDSLPMAGKTDWQIVTELLVAMGLDSETIAAKLPICFDAIAQYMSDTTKTRRIRTCPGVPPLLNRLCAQPQIILGLLTGNLLTTAPIKLRAAGIEPAYFWIGAYGNDGHQRSSLPAVALGRAQALIGQEIAGQNVIIVGDTPADMTCGQHLGVKAVGVATGHFGPEQLRAAGADHVVPHMRDTQAILQIFIEAL